MFRIFVSVSAIAVVLVASARGQMVPMGGTGVYGQVSAGNAPLASWTVQLSHVGGGETLETELLWNGVFEFRGVQPGEHRLRVLDGKGQVVHDDMISVRRDGETLSIHVRQEDSSQGSRGETVSVQQLAHKSPKKALNELKNGRAALEKQQFARAVTHLQSAVAVDPDFADAQNDLSVAYFELQQYDRSVEHFRKAVGLAPTHQRANNNLCLALLRAGRYAEAGQAANGAHQRGNGSALTHYAAAMGLLSAGGGLDEAVDHLRRAQSQLPKAGLLAARVLAGAGRSAEAARQLQAYLRTPQADADPKRPELEKWLAELKR